VEVSGQLHVPAALPQAKSSWYPLDRRLRGPQSRSGRGGDEENSRPLLGIERPIIKPIAQRYTHCISANTCVFQRLSLGLSEKHSSSFENVIVYFIIQIILKKGAYLHPELRILIHVGGSVTIFLHFLS
jgi:hypothetical protein